MLIEYTLKTLAAIVPERGSQTIHARIVNPITGWEWYLLSLSAAGVADCVACGFSVERGLVDIQELLGMDNPITATYLDSAFTPRPLAGVMPTLKPVAA